MQGTWFWALPEDAQEGAHTKNSSTFEELITSEEAQESSSNTKMLKISPLSDEGAQKFCVSTPVSTFGASLPGVRLHGLTGTRLGSRLL
jgi:hypothetical protein